MHRFGRRRRDGGGAGGGGKGSRRSGGGGRNWKQRRRGKVLGREDSSGSGATRGTDTHLVSSSSSADLPGTSASGSENSVSRASSLDTLLEKPRDESPLVSSESTSGMDVAGTVDTPLTGVTDPGSGSGGWMGKMVRRLMFWRRSSSESIPEVVEAHVEGTSVDPEISEVVETHIGNTSGGSGISEVVESHVELTSSEVRSSTGATKGHGKSEISTESDCFKQQEAEGTFVNTIVSHGVASAQFIPSVETESSEAGMVNPTEPNVSEAASMEPSVDNLPAPETQGGPAGHVASEVKLQANNTEPSQHTCVETIQSSITSTESRINPSPNSIQASTDVDTDTTYISCDKTVVVKGYPIIVASADSNTKTTARIVDDDGSFLGSFTVHEYNPDGMVGGGDNVPDGMVPGGDSVPDGMVPGGDNAPDDTTTVNISAFDEADGVENIVENVYTIDSLNNYSIEVEHTLPGDTPNIMPLSGKEGFSLLSVVIPEKSVSNDGDQNLKSANTIASWTGNEGFNTDVSPGGAKSDFGRPVLGEQEIPQPGEDDASAVGVSCIEDRGDTQERGVSVEDVHGYFSPEYPDTVDTDRRLLQIAEDSMIDSSSCVEDHVSRSSLSGDFYIEGPQQRKGNRIQHTSPAHEEVSKERIKPWF